MEIEMYNFVFVPVISGLVEVFKQIGLPKKYSAFISVVIGLLVGIFFVDPANLRNGILVGIILGLSASGLYSGTKSVQHTFKDIKGQD